MVNVAHSTLTGAELHEPKGVASAASGTVYIANGSGSGAWTALTTVAPTGMVADFALPIAPSGWLECDGSDVSTTTYSGLYAAMTIQQTGTRTNGTAVITSLSSTTHMRAGYYVFGTGFASGTTIVSIDSATQITVSNNASSSGSATVVVSPWLLNTGTIRLPLTTDDGGYFRRSRSSGIDIGDKQISQNKAHTHTVSGTSGLGGIHSHTISVSDPTHRHAFEVTTSQVAAGIGPQAVTSIIASGGSSGALMSFASTGVTATSSTQDNHTHSFSATTASAGGTEARPISLVLMTCVKT